ncbi:MAG: hypothetical protein XD78_1641 [Desulfotomaculum sp. 46_296]|nr:MAG: hypothetical protein XD78_1641 [Desulfotomaculum sp. 46_296]HAU32269.1 hypothetical protein [Desulfotomaculum sp.]
MYGELIGVHFAGYIAKDFNFAIPADFYYYLSQMPDGYSLADDWYSFYSEEWDWYRERLTIVDLPEIQSPQYMAAHIQVQVLPQLAALRQEIASYYPRYSDVQELKRLFLAALDTEYELFVATANMINNPYLHSQSIWETLMDRTKVAYSKYEQHKNTLFTRFKR